MINKRLARPGTVRMAPKGTLSFRDGHAVCDCCPQSERAIGPRRRSERNLKTGKGFQRYICQRGRNEYRRQTGRAPPVIVNLTRDMTPLIIAPNRFWMKTA